MAYDLTMSDSFVQKLTRVVEANMDNGHFGAEDLASEIGLSRSQVYRKLKSITGKSTNQFIREIRLRTAHELLQDQVGTASEIGYKVGFNSPAYFSTCFHDYFGYPPSSVKTVNSRLGQIQNDKEAPVHKLFQQSFWKKTLIAVPILLILFLSYILSPRNSNDLDNAQVKPVSSVIEEYPNSNSIAILPFRSLSNNEEDQFLADAVMEQISQHLQRIPLSEISLRSNLSTETYRNTDKGAIEIGQELDVKYILQATFQKIGDTANLSVQLINAKTDEHVWAEEYRRNWKEIFTVQAEIAKKVADKLSATFSETALKAIETEPTDNMEAYRYYLMGLRAFRSYFYRFDTLQLTISEKKFKQALDIDKNFSSAYTGLAKVNMAYIRIRDKTKINALVDTAKSYLEKAVELDPYNGMAYSELGNYHWKWRWDSIAARKNFNHAIMLEPNNYHIYDSYFEFEFVLGNCDVLNHLLQRMTRIRPYIGDPYHVYKLKTLLCQNDFERVANLADKYWNENFSVVYTRLFFWGYLYTNNFGKAHHMLNHLEENSKRRNFQPFMFHGVLSAFEGDSISALAYIDSLNQLSTKEYISKATIYAGMGDKDNMYRNLELAISTGQRVHQSSRPGFVSYRNEDRFREIWAMGWAPKGHND